MGEVTNYSTSKGLAVRKVSPRQVDISIVTEWINRCSAKHGKICRKQQSPKLQNIHLIDVLSKRVVSYAHIQRDEPWKGVEYLCLSYVWGPAMQSIKVSGSRLKKVPATIRDAMDFVRLIGKQYLWVDSVSQLWYRSTYSLEHDTKGRAVFRKSLAIALLIIPLYEVVKLTSHDMASNLGIDLHRSE